MVRASEGGEAWGVPLPPRPEEDGVSGASQVKETPTPTNASPLRVSTTPKKQVSEAGVAPSTPLPPEVPPSAPGQRPSPSPKGNTTLRVFITSLCFM